MRFLLKSEWQTLRLANVRFVARRDFTHNTSYETMCFKNLYDLYVKTKKTAHFRKPFNLKLETWNLKQI